MKKGDTTRQQIIERSAPLFNQYGFAGASMQQIMQATGLEKGGIYRHFESKQQLAAEAFRFALERAIAARTAHLDGIPNAVDRLLHMVEAFIEVPSPVPGGCPLMNTGVDADNTNPELKRLARDGVRAWKQRIEQTVTAGIARGEIHPEANAARLANLMIATLEGALLITRLESSRDALRDAQSHLNQTLESLRSKP